MLIKILLWTISKTNLLRNLILSLVGALVAAGVLDEAGGKEAAAGLIILATSLLNWWVERAKTEHVLELQEGLLMDGEPIKVDGYFGVKTKRAVYRKIKGDK